MRVFVCVLFAIVKHACASIQQEMNQICMRHRLDLILYSAEGAA